MFMNLNTNKWKEYKVGELFEIISTKGVNSEELLEGNDVPYIAAKKDDNGLKFMCQREGYEDWISKGNCIVFIQLGQGSAGYALYVPDDFIGMSGKTSCGYIDVMTPEIGLFLTTILSKERPKYSFGRSGTGDRLKETIIKLPTLFENDKPIIDKTKKYSKLGYSPDWDFMEQYIKSLNYKPLTTQNSNPQQPLNIDSWQEFLIGNIFEIYNGKFITKEEIDENPGDFCAVQSGEENNGVLGKIDKQYCIDKGYIYTNQPCLTVARSGSAGYVSYQNFGCVVGDSAKILLLKDSSWRTLYIYLFFKTLLMANKFKYTYGRKVTEDKYLNEIIKLPVKLTKEGNIMIDTNKKYSAKGFVPDFEFMENYIKSLPFGDRI